jgi:hypothetical protein
LNLSERENKFLQMIYDHTGGDASQILVGEELHQLAGRNGFNDHEVLSISVLLNGLGLLEKQRHKGENSAGEDVLRVSCVKLTSSGVIYVRSLE